MSEQKKAAEKNGKCYKTDPKAQHKALSLTSVPHSPIAVTFSLAQGHGAVTPAGSTRWGLQGQEVMTLHGDQGCSSCCSGALSPLQPLGPWPSLSILWV